MDNRLILVNEQGNESPPQTYILDNCPSLTDIDTEIVLQVSDIAQPENGNGSFTRTIDIPGTQEVDVFFENAYSVNINLKKFNPNLKVRAYYYENELLAFDGNLQILSIELDEISGYHVYKCNIIGEVVTFWTLIKDKQLTELVTDLNISNHALSAAVIGGSWTNVNPNFVYPLLDRGQAGVIYQGLGVSQYAGNGCIMLHKYVDAMFQNAGMTYTSTFLSSTFFKRLILTPGKIPQLSASVIAQNKFLATPTATQTLNKALVNADPIYTFSGSTDTVNYATEVYDTGNVFINPTYTPTVSNFYNVKSDFLFSVQVLDASNNDITANYTFVTGTITISVPFVGTKTLFLQDWTPGSATQNAISIEALNKFLVASTPLSASVVLNNFLISKNSGANAATLRFSIIDGSFSSEFASNAPFAGQTVTTLDMIPENYSCNELMTDIRKMFNLHFTVDKTNPKNIIIEPYNDFYLSTAKDWTYKHDKGRTIEIKPTGDLNNNKYTFKYTDESDYFNRKYLGDFKELYGTHKEEIENDFIKGESLIELKNVAPTTLVGNQYSGAFVISTWREQDETTIKEYKSKPRILYWAGLIGASNNAKPIKFNGYDNAGNVVPNMNTYPYAGHLDNPFNPTIDLNFGLVDYVYYIKPNQTLTDNNLYNKYYSRMMNQIKDPDSKIIITYFRLTNEDINKFDFRNPIFTIINDEPGYYLVNRIVYPTNGESALVELLKLVDYPIHTPNVIEFNNGLGSTDMGTARAINMPIAIGDDNTNYGDKSAIIGGSGNFIPEGSESVTLINTKDLIPDEPVENFFGVGENVVPLDNSANIYNSIKTSKESGQLYYTTQVYQKAERLDSAVRSVDFTVDGAKAVYYIDLSHNDVTATIDIPNMINFAVTFVITDIAGSPPYNFYITSASSPVTEYIGANTNTLPYNVTNDYGVGDSLKIHSNGSNLFKI